MPPIESILQFPNPSTPDLGCFVRRKHGVKLDDGFHNIHVELNPSIDFGPRYHQLYFRVMCGRAAFFQKCLVYMRSDLSIPPPNLPVFPPDWVLGGAYTPRPSEWYRYPTQAGQRFYFFIGQHQDPAGGPWRADALVAHSYDIYENGTYSIVRFDDTGGDRDLDDLMLEVALVGRRSWRDVVVAVDQAAVNERVAREGLPKLKRRIGKIEAEE